MCAVLHITINKQDIKLLIMRYKLILSSSFSSFFWSSDKEDLFLGGK